MNSAAKLFLLGAGAGAAIAAITFQFWSLHVEGQIRANGQVHVLRPLSSDSDGGDLSNQTFRFPRPWFPDFDHPVDGDWTLKPLDGQPVALSSFRGKAVFLNFWETSCGPCLAEMSAIEKLRVSLAGDPVIFAAVTDEPESTVRTFLAKRPIGVPVYLRGTTLPAQLKFLGIPTTYLLNARGVAVFKSTGEMNWDDDAARNQLRALASE